MLSDKDIESQSKFLIEINKFEDFEDFDFYCFYYDCSGLDYGTDSSILSFSSSSDSSYHS